jgi:hypothetical protein
MPTQTSQATGVAQVRLISMTISQILLFTQRPDGVIETSLSLLLTRAAARWVRRRRENCKIFVRFPRRELRLSAKSTPTHGSNPRRPGKFWLLGVTHFTEKIRGSAQNDPVADAHGRSQRQETAARRRKSMSIRTTPTQRSIAQHKAPKIVGIAGLLAAVLTANIADAATSSHHRQSLAAMSERSWAAYAPRGISAASQVAPASGRGIFEEHNSAP